MIEKAAELMLVSFFGAGILHYLLYRVRQDLFRG